MATDKDKFEVHDAVVIRESEKALLVEAPVFDEEQWVPKNQIDDDSEVWGEKEGRNEGTLIVSKWIAEQKGWTDE
jgi:hypothetical protein